MQSRFECPRCQTVFVRDVGADAAFIECPSCGALALPAGEATEGEFGRALSGAMPLPAVGRGLASTEAEQRAVNDSLSSDSRSSEGRSSSGEGFSTSPPSDPSFGMPQTFGGAGVFSGLLAQPPADAQAPPADDLDLGLEDRGFHQNGSDDDDAPRGMDLSRQLTHSGEGDAVGGASGGSDGGGLNFDLEGELGDAFAGFGAPVTTPAPRQKLPDLSRALTRDESSGPKRPAYAASTSGEGNALDDDDAGTQPRPAPWSALSDEAFGDLEKAFDEVSVRAPRRGKDGLSDDDRRFLRSDGSKAPPLPPTRSGGDGATGRRQAPPPPPLPQRTAPARPSPPRKRPRPSALTLSDEAKRLAFLPAKAESSGGQVAAPRAAARPAVDDDALRRTAAKPRASDTGESTDLVRTKRPPREVPRATAGLSALRALALVVVSLGVGLGVGAVTADPKERPQTGRLMAEREFAQGNRFYEQGRFDDALGSYKGAVARDRTFAPGHRAKGVALAKLQRFDEAADAYRDYLALEPGALDAKDVRDSLVRRYGQKKVEAWERDAKEDDKGAADDDSAPKDAAKDDAGNDSAAKDDAGKDSAATDAG